MKVLIQAKMSYFHLLFKIGKQLYPKITALKFDEYKIFAIFTIVWILF